MKHRFDTARRQIVLDLPHTKKERWDEQDREGTQENGKLFCPVEIHFEDLDFFWLFGVRRGEEERLRERRDRLGESLRDLDLEI